jgi:hypothetical protein
MKRTILAASALAAAGLLAVVALAAPPAATGNGKGGKPPTVAADPPTVTSVASLMEKELHWGMTHQEVIDAYNKLNGLFDREYSPQLAKMQPGSDMQQLEADRDSRKSNFERSFTRFLDTPTGYDVTPLFHEYTYKNDEAIMKVFKDGKTRYFFYIKDKFWKLYDEIPLKADGALGGTFQDAVTKLNQLFNVPARIRPADPTQGLDRTTADWQDGATHLRALDRSSEHLLGVVLEDKNTLSNLSSLRPNKPTDPFAIDPSIAAITKKGVSDPNAAQPGAADAGSKKKR